MHEEFDEHIRKRLRHYSEEPDDDLWKFVVPPPPYLKNGGKNLTLKVNKATSALSLIPLVFVVFHLVRNIGMEPVIADSQRLEKVEVQAEAGTHKSKTDNIDEVSQNEMMLSKKRIYDKTYTILNNKKDARGTAVNQNTPGSARVNGEHDLPGYVASAEKNDRLTMDEPVRLMHGEALLVEEEKDTVHRKEISKEGDKKPEQESEKEKEKQHKFRAITAYLLAMPTFGYQHVEANKNDDIFIEGLNRIPNFSAKRLGVRLEAGVQIPLSKRIQAAIGVVYFQRKQTIEYTLKSVDSMQVVSAEETTVELAPSFNYDNRSFEYELKNVGLHGGLNYVISTGKFLHTVGTGIEIHKGLRTPSINQEQMLGKNPSLYLFYNLFYRIQYPATGKLKSVFQPTINRSLYFNENVNAPFYVKPYGLGLSIGVTYDF